jgi:hypothetical protein
MLDGALFCPGGPYAFTLIAIVPTRAHEEVPLCLNGVTRVCPSGVRALLPELCHPRVPSDVEELTGNPRERVDVTISVDPNV